MRTVTFSDGRKFEAKPLTVGQVRRLRDVKGDSLEQMFATVEAAGVSLDDYDSLPFTDLANLHKAILAETYGLPEEVKN